MRLAAPRFWERGRGGVPARLLTPLGAVVGALAARRNARVGPASGVAVFCCGNATVGGAGKTILALDLLARLEARGLAPHALTRGHGGRSRSPEPVRVALDRHTARDVGDEALLLARAAPTWVGSDRGASAARAEAAGAGALVMDDGLQNASLRRDCSFLVIDGPAGFGNGRILPAGPLRERPEAAVSRVRAIVLIGEDRTGAARRFVHVRPILAATLVPDAADLERLRGRRLVAFAGIGRPRKFFETLEAAGCAPVRTIAWPDHHRYRPRDLALLAGAAERDQAVLVTTNKDAVRLPAGFARDVATLGVRLAWADGRIDRVLDAALQAARR